MTPAIGRHSSPQIFSFVIWAKAQPIEEAKFILCDRDGYFGLKCNIAAGLAPNDGPDLSLNQADDPVWDASAL